MRIYYIYIQGSKLINVHTEYSLYKWLPFELLGCVEGTRELYNVFRGYSPFWKPQFCDELLYDNQYFKRYTSSNSFDGKQSLERFLIMDDGGIIRDFYELTNKYKKKRKIRWHSAVQDHYVNNIGERRKDITPEEVREVKNEYGFTMLPVKPKRKFTPWGIDTYNTYSKGWKDQTKRRKQYKIKNVE